MATRLGLVEEIHIVAAILLYVVPLCLWVGVLVSILRRRWAERKASISVIRELYGAISANGAQGGYVIAGGRFTREARDFGCDMTEAAPVCPQCGSGMIERTATRGQFVGMPFWGCRRYPGCRGIVPLEQADAAPRRHAHWRSPRSVQPSAANGAGI